MKRNPKNYQLALIILASAALFSISQNALARGFALLEQSVTNLGLAYAGTGSLAVDASTGFYNSAGLTRLGQEQLVVGGTLLLFENKLKVTQATDTFGHPLNSVPVSTRPKADVLIPFFHYAHRINECWIFSFNAAPIFGSRMNYGTKSVARYMNTTSKLQTIDLSPSIAYGFDNGISVGAGIDAVYAKVNLYQQLGFGNTATDGSSANQGKDWGYGYHVGLLYEPTDCTRFGISFRSKVDLKFKGNSTVQFLAPETTQQVRANITLPESILLSAYHALNEQWAIMADYQWFHWNRFDKLTLRYANGSQATSFFNYKNSYRVSLGGSYQHTPCLQFKMGGMYDKTPTQNFNRNIFITDQDYIIPAVGVQYRFTQNLALDFAYTHVFFIKKTPIHQASPTVVGGSQPLSTLNGSIKPHGLEALGLQLTWDIL